MKSCQKSSVHISHLFHFGSSILPIYFFGMSFSHFFNKVDLVVKEVNYFWFKLISFENDRCPIFIGIIDLFIGDITLEETSSSMLIHKVFVYIGIDLQIIPSLSVVFQIIVTVGQLIHSLLIGDCKVRLE